VWRHSPRSRMGGFMHHRGGRGHGDHGAITM
jgi:hypothetical protein